MKGQINKDLLGKFKEEFGKLARKAVKLGLDSPKYTLGEEHMVLDVEANANKPEWMPDVYKCMIDVEVEDVNVIIGDWEAVGEIRNENVLGVESESGKSQNEALYYAYLGKELPVECCQKDPMLCEHCGTKRYRKLSYIIRNTKSGEYKQVGSSCVEDFVMVKNVEKLMKWLETYTELIQLERTNEPHGTPYIYVESVLPYIVHILKSHKFCAGISDDSTIEVAMKLSNREYVRGYDKVTDAELATASEESEKIVAFFKHWIEENISGKYFNVRDLNLAKIACSKYLLYDDNNAGNLAYAVHVYNKTLAREKAMEEVKEANRRYYEEHKEEIEAERARIAAAKAKEEAHKNDLQIAFKSGYYGNVNDSVELKNAKVLLHRSGCSIYGEWILLSVLHNEYVFKFFINEKSKSFESAKNVREGDYIDCSGTIKGHSEYNEHKSTELKNIKNLCFAVVA